MKFIRVVVQFANEGFYCRQFNRSFSASFRFGNSVGPGNNGNQNANSAEFTDESEKLFRPVEYTSPSFYHSLDKVEKAKYRSSVGLNPSGDSSSMVDEEDDALSSLLDGTEGKLKKAPSYFEVNPQEILQDDYTYRADMNLKSRMTYTPEDLNIRKPGVWKPSKRPEFEVTTKEVLENADFRNVKFLANFLTEAGIIIKRRQTGISAKAQRKVAREIKIARAFGLLPFTTMGTKSFVFGRSMESLDQDYELDPYDTQARVADVPDPVEE